MKARLRARFEFTFAVFFFFLLLLGLVFFISNSLGLVLSVGVPTLIVGWFLLEFDVPEWLVERYLKKKFQQRKMTGLIDFFFDDISKNDEQELDEHFEKTKDNPTIR